MINDKDGTTGDESRQKAKPAGDSKIPENKTSTVPGSPPDPKLMEKFIHGDSTHEIKQAAKEIIASDSEVDEGKLKEAGIQFQEEKKEDKAKRAENDAEFDQPAN